jgi:D-3-phosphoglycerate dehydrogenase / 2-oxoglutarate reductase
MPAPLRADYYGAQRRRIKAPKQSSKQAIKQTVKKALMKSIFIDCNKQLAPVFARVSRPDDPPIAVHGEAFSARDLPALLAGYDICLDDHSYMPTEVMGECRSLKHVVFLGTGASSYMDVAALDRLGIKVHTIKGYGDTAVAEHAVALIFACCRDLARMDRGVRRGVWDPLESMQLRDKTLGLIGIGGIGREVARIAHGIGMTVIGWNRTARADAGVPLVDLDTLLARADVISLHLALNDETRGMIGADELARMKPGVILVNTARAALVDETALIDALREGHIRHAGLDVFHAEPLSPEHALARLENVTLTSHAAFRTLEASMTLMRRAIDIVRGLLKD